MLRGGEGNSREMKKRLLETDIKTEKWSIEERATLLRIPTSGGK